MARIAEFAVRKLTWLFLIGLLILSTSNGSTINNEQLEIVHRSGWKALPPRLVEEMTTPVPYVVIHHSYIPPACNTSGQCIEAMLEMQRMHQVKNKWNDIGYSFAVGGDGAAYEGRGWHSIGAHAPKYNNRSIGICVIGDWTEQLPPVNQLTTVKRLIDYGVSKGYIEDDYALLGHRQTRPTECPGERLYQEIKTWNRWDPTKPELPETAPHGAKGKTGNSSYGNVAHFLTVLVCTLATFFTKILQ